MILNVNGKDYELEVKPDEVLLDSLRSLGFLSVRRGCNTSSCCICTVMIDGSPVLSCSYLTRRAEHTEIYTVEGLLPDSERLAVLLSEEGADQCGYCGPALIVAAICLKRENPKASEEEIYEYMNSNYCRCSGYKGQMRAVKRFFNER